MNENTTSDFDLLVITGPTASGKTALAAELAFRLKGEIISADSRQVYREMNLGTGKDYDDYVINGNRIPYHLIDIADPGYKYNVFEYQHDFLEVYNDLKSRRIFPVVCGGSGMYLDSIISGYKLYEVPPDPEFRATLEKRSLDELTEILSTYRKLHNLTDVDTKKRAIRAIEIERFNRVQSGKYTKLPEIRPLVAGVRYEREIRRQRITERLKKRLDDGMVEEVRKLLKMGLTSDELMYYGLEYKYITMYLSNKLTYSDMFRELEIAIHQFAKRQMTWFRGMERKGTIIHWLDGELPMEEKVKQVMRWLT